MTSISFLKWVQGGITDGNWQVNIRDRPLFVVRRPLPQAMTAGHAPPPMGVNSG